MEELEEVEGSRLQSNPDRALAASIDILEGLATLHSLNVAHCDIKDSAVMV
jgi:serine/threonine protein kinase